MTDGERAPIRAVMIFAPDPERACHWYVGHVMRLNPSHVRTEAGFWFVEIGGVEVGFHPADEERNPRGANVVAYFTSDAVEHHRDDLIAAGATPHRGPLVIDDDRSIAQLVDPFGGVFGLDGPP